MFARIKELKGASAETFPKVAISGTGILLSIHKGDVKDEIRKLTGIEGLDDIDTMKETATTALQGKDLFVLTTETQQWFTTDKKNPLIDATIAAINAVDSNDENITDENGDEVLLYKLTKPSNQHVVRSVATTVLALEAEDISPEEQAQISDYNAKIDRLMEDSSVTKADKRQQFLASQKEKKAAALKAMADKAAERAATAVTAETNPLLEDVTTP